MHIVAIGWMFVVVLMAAAEATAPNGTLLGAAFTLLLYGLLPLGLVLYILATPARKRMRQEAKAMASEASQGDPALAASPAIGPAIGPADASIRQQADAGGHAASAAVAPERVKP
jgi:hypothetical protein